MTANFQSIATSSYRIIDWLETIPSLESATNSTLVVASMDNDDDPWDWSIDRVVKEFCTADRSWELRSASMVQPDPVSLAAALRDQQVTGDTLLNEVDHTTMKDDLGIRTLGQRAFVNHGISILRSRSAKYRAASQAKQPALSRLMFDELARAVRTLSEGNTGRSQQAGNENPIIRGPPNDTIQENEIVEAGDSFFGGKRQKVNHLDAAADLDHSFADIEPEKRLLSTAAASALEPSSDTLQNNGKKRKRIAPTLITSQIDHNQVRHIPTAADFVTVEQEPEPEPAHDPVPEPGVTFFDGNGKKRMVPVWQAPASEAGGLIVSNTALLLPRDKISKGGKHVPGYLGRRKMTVDHIFYADVSVGDELSKSSVDSDGVEEFSMMSTDIPNGKRIYVHNTLRRFLQTEPRKFQRDGEVFTAIVPYPEKLALKYHQQTFSLYSSVSARREDVDSWPEIRTAVPSHQMTDAHTSNFNPPGPGILGKSGYEESFDPLYLENKYKYLEGGDEVLPLYGDSDEDNEYDLATWREIEEERGELEGIRKMTKRSFLSLDEIDQAIDEGLKGLVERWASNKLPKLLKRGYKLWRISRKEGTKKARIVGAKEDLGHIHQRIAKMRKEILADQWTSKAHVLKQVPIFEVNIFVREELNWRIKLLEQNYCPEKPSPSDVAQKKTMKLPHTEEEGESIDSEDDASSSDDGLGDFLVEDELVPSTEQELHELNLADTEQDSDDSDGSGSDVNMSNESQSTPLFLPSPNNASTPIKIEAAGLPQHRTHEAMREPQVFDLTMVSSSPDSPGGSGFIDLVTPVKPKVKLNLTPARKELSPIVIEESDDETLDVGDVELPDLGNPAAVAKRSYVFWAKVLDRNRLLVTMFYKMEVNMRKLMLHFISDLSRQDLWDHIIMVKEALQEFYGKPKGTRDTKFRGIEGMDDATLQILQGYIKLFESYLDCCYYAWRETPDLSSINKLTLDNASQFTSFFKLCRSIQYIFSQDKSQKANETRSQEANETRKAVNASDSDDDSDEDARLPTKRHRPGDASDGEAPPVSSQKRRRLIYENTEARDRRAQDMRRLQEQEQRRKVLHANLAKDNLGNDEARGRIIINDAAGADENLIYVTPHTASRIKSHQIDGVRFMWNQVVAGELMQGCLLAHTMGLGKVSVLYFWKYHADWW